MSGNLGLSRGTPRAGIHIHLTSRQKGVLSKAKSWDNLRKPKPPCASWPWAVPFGETIHPGAAFFSGLARGSRQVTAPSGDQFAYFFPEGSDWMFWGPLPPDYPMILLRVPLRYRNYPNKQPCKADCRPSGPSGLSSAGTWSMPMLSAQLFHRNWGLLGTGRTPEPNPWVHAQD